MIMAFVPFAATRRQNWLTPRGAAVPQDSSQRISAARGMKKRVPHRMCGSLFARNIL